MSLLMMPDSQSADLKTRVVTDATDSGQVRQRFEINLDSGYREKTIHFSS